MEKTKLHVQQSGWLEHCKPNYMYNKVVGWSKANQTTCTTMWLAGALQTKLHVQQSGWLEGGQSKLHVQQSGRLEQGKSNYMYNKVVGWSMAKQTTCTTKWLAGARQIKLHVQQSS